MALPNQQKLGMKVFIYSDVKTKYLDMYLAADFEVESLHDVTRLVERLRGSPGSK